MREGQLAADGQLTSIPTSDRWVRDAQRMRLHIALDDPLTTALASLPQRGTGHGAAMAGPACLGGALRLAAGAPGELAALCLLTCLLIRLGTGLWIGLPNG